jgi:hypothetical protein
MDILMDPLSQLNGFMPNLNYASHHIDRTHNALLPLDIG